MKALTIRQPWATLIAYGVKTIETRSWHTNYRGPVAIHAGATRPADYWYHDHREPKYPIPLAPLYEHDLCLDAQSSDDGEWWRCRWAGPLGAVIATATLADCLPMIGANDDRPEGLHLAPAHLGTGDRWYLSDEWLRDVRDITAELPYGDYTPGRWGWLLTDVQPIDPVPAKGKLGFWEWTP